MLGVIGGARVFLVKREPEDFNSFSLAIRAKYPYLTLSAFNQHFSPPPIFFFPGPLQSMIKTRLNDKIVISKLNPAKTNHKSLEWGKNLEIREMDSRQQWSLQHLKNRKRGESHPKTHGNFPSLPRWPQLSKLSPWHFYLRKWVNRRPSYSTKHFRGK